MLTFIRKNHAINNCALRHVTIDLNNWTEFIDREFSNISRDNDPAGRWSTNRVLEEPLRVTIENRDSAVSFNAEMAMVIFNNDEECAIRFFGHPATLNDAVKTARELCNLCEIDDSKINRWYNGRDYDDPLKRSCLQIGENKLGRHEVTIKMSFEELQPYRILYFVVFSRKRNAR